MSRSGAIPNAAQIQHQADRILASEVFAASDRLREFLRYVVSEAIGDGKPRLKEMAIGIAVFGRDERFDPRIDSVVRVEAGRLRAKLTEYYADPGRDDPVLISIPKGGYVPHFTPNPTRAGDEPPAPAEPRRRVGPRVASALALLVAAVALLAWWRAQVPEPTGREPPYSIAVLPLSDWTGQVDDYFSEAMTDVLISKLSERPQLRVTSLGSVLGYRSGEASPLRIAEQLGVDNLVEGTVFRESGRVRITVNLIDAEAGKNVWSKTFNRAMTGVLALQQEVAGEIASRLVGQLDRSDGHPPREINPLAYEAFLKGIYWRNRLTAEGFNRGLVYFQQAIALQPDYSEAYAAMAACHCRLAGHGIEVVRPDLALREATRLASRALELDGALAEPNAVLGIISFKYEWNAEAARRYLVRALEQNPSLFEARLWLSQVAEGMGRTEEAIENARKAQQVNPLSLAAGLNLGWQLHQAGRTTEAEIEFDKLVEFDPGFWGGHWGKGHIHRAQGMLSEAIEAFSRAVELEGGHTLPLASLGFTLAKAGRRAEALAIIDRLDATARDIYVSPVHAAMVYAGLGDADAAFERLDQALEIRARAMAWLTARREFEGLREDPRYRELVRRIGIDSDTGDAGA